MNEQLQKKVDFAIRLLQGAEKMAEKVGQPVEVQYSGGKDSEVILELAKMSGIKFRAIYKNTTIDPPGTIKHAKEKGVEVMAPAMTFREVLEKHGIVSRFRRACCQHLKEYKILDYAVLGIRRCESKKRTERYKEPELCRIYNKNDKTRQYLPILEWTDQDVADFIQERGLKCHPLYYDEQGNFHPERRLGCMGCPMASNKKRVEEFKQHPNMVKFWCRGGKNSSIPIPTARFMVISTMPTNGFVCHCSARTSASSTKSLERICLEVEQTARHFSRTTSASNFD